MSEDLRHAAGHGREHVSNMQIVEHDAAARGELGPYATLTNRGGGDLAARHLLSREPDLAGRHLARSRLLCFAMTGEDDDKRAEAQAMRRHEPRCSKVRASAGTLDLMTNDRYALFRVQTCFERMLQSPDRSVPRRREGLQGILRPCRKLQPEDGASLRIRHGIDDPTMGFDDALGDGESEPGPRSLRRDERLEQSPADRSIDPGPGIDDADFDVLRES